MIEIQLRSHEQHIEILNRIRPHTKYIEIVVPYADAPSDELIVKLQPFFIERKQVKSWQGTFSKGKASTLYRYQYSRDVFKILETYTAFFFSRDNQRGEPFAEYTPFGDKDIAFCNAENDVLFYTTTHEAIAEIQDDFATDL